MKRGGGRRGERPGDARIEHTRQREVIKPVLSEVEGTADWIIDLGPEGGDKGGEVVAEGTPEDVAKEKRSYTGQYLAEILARSERVESGPAIKLTKARSRVSKHEREAAE